MATRSDAEAGAALMALISQRFSDAEVSAWAGALRELRRAGVLRRQQVRRQSAALLLRRLPREEREATREALSWLFGDVWLPPSNADVARAMGGAGAHPTERTLDL